MLDHTRLWPHKKCDWSTPKKKLEFPFSCPWKTRRTSSRLRRRGGKRRRRWWRRRNLINTGHSESATSGSGCKRFNFRRRRRRKQKIRISKLDLGDLITCKQLSIQIYSKINSWFMNRLEFCSLPNRHEKMLSSYNIYQICP